MRIRLEEPKDYMAVHAVNEAAFDTTAEADLVETLRKEVHPVVSLVAEEQGEIVGHILFSPVMLSSNANLKIMGLAPMAVEPGHQRKGVGSELVRIGLEKCQELGAGAVVVLGHTWFHPRFGFLPAVQYNIYCEYKVPVNVFMVLELQPGYLCGESGIIRYHPAFKDV